MNVSLYLCTRCPYCARFVPQLYKAIVEGLLEGVAKAYVREFPIRGHEGATEGGLGLVAAARLGKGWQFLLRLYQNFDSFQVDTLPKYAVEVGLQEDEFRNLLGDASLRNELTASKKEGVRNGVEATPAIFINGRMYAGDVSIETVADVINEEAERMKAAGN